MTGDKNMKKVKDTKNPTVKQFISMSKNLQEKFKKYASLTIETHSYTHIKETEVEYRLYVEDKTDESFDTWSDLLQYYHEVIKEEI